jgi:hypothetical protein
MTDEEKQQNERNAANAIVANVLRRMLRNQNEEYSKARAILDICELSEQARTVVQEEPGIIAALYAITYDQTGQLRKDDQGLPLGRAFIDSKVLNLKANPYREPTAMLLRGLFMDFRNRLGSEYQKCWRHIWHQLQQTSPDFQPRNIAVTEEAA